VCEWLAVCGGVPSSPLVWEVTTLGAWMAAVAMAAARLGAPSGGGAAAEGAAAAGVGEAVRSERAAAADFVDGFFITGA